MTAIKEHERWFEKAPPYSFALSVYGEFVTPKDADLVLMRWKVSDNEYRVIFGDRHAETVTVEVLEELEKELPNNDKNY